MHTTNDKAAPRTGTASTPRTDNNAFLEDLKTILRQMIELGATPNDEPLDCAGWLKLAEKIRGAVHHE